MSIYNRLRLKLYGIKYGKHCVIHGKLYIKLHPSANVTIGNNFYCSSGQNVNALSANKRGGIYATENSTVKVGNNVGMSSVVLWAHSDITIEDYVKIGANTIIMDTDSHNLDHLLRRNQYTDWGPAIPVLIKQDAFIGANCMILKGVTIGERSIVAAGSIVRRDVPSDCIVAGNPAVVVKRLTVTNQN